MTGAALRGDRIHRYVNAFCPYCHVDDPHRALSEVKRLAGWLVERDGTIWLERGCREHGRVTTMYDEDPEILRYLEEWTAPTKQHVPDATGNYLPVPEAYLQGLPEMQTQHTCILLEDIAAECNLRCPTCFTDSSPQMQGIAAIEDVLASIDQRLARENGRIDVLMLSGGEPTIHPRFADILEAVVARNVVRILVNTNGVLLARDDDLLGLLKKHRDRVEVYLQFDGLSADASRHHRGGDLTATKAKAIARLSEAGVFTTLTMTVAKGVNDHEIGDVVMLALRTPYVGGVSIQPQFGSGRSGDIDWNDRLTHTGVLKRLGPQTGGLVEWRDLTALPCSHPHCCSVGYLLQDDAGEWNSLTSLVGHDQLKEFLDLNPDLVANRIADSEINLTMRSVVKESLLGLLSEQSSLSSPTVTSLWRDVCTNCDLGIGTMMALASSALPGGKERLREMLGTRIKRVTIKPFMDMATMIEERLTQCCVHVGTVSDERSHQCAPFCAVQAWPRLSAQRLAWAVPQGRELPLVTT